ncbi:MAG: OmpA family protein [Saprospiraceae bacterium]|nr:OmpA family protein [Saprospiraceae bacterium]MDW8483431.1 OmpA family protein [Saprospiraceae bacterium]
MKNWSILSLLLFLISKIAAQTQNSHPKDKVGAADHPMITRMSHFYIADYLSNYDAFEFRLSSAKRQRVEGKRTRIYYKHDKSSPEPSVLQIMRNYENAIKHIGGKTIAIEERYGYATFRLDREKDTVWVSLSNFLYNPIQFQLDIVEREAMMQEVTARDILKGLETDGFYGLYILFDTNSDQVKPESVPLVRAIVDLLKQNPSLRVSIDGHTDNVGDAAYNKALSERRARTVYNLVLQQGIPANRLQYRGFGSEVPIADNRKESGRAQNRRVEVVKL